MRRSIDLAICPVKPNKCEWNIFFYYYYLIYRFCQACSLPRKHNDNGRTKTRFFAAHVKLICFKQGRVGLKLLEVNTRLKINQMIYKDIQTWFIAYFFDTGHPCCSQLTHIKTKYPLTCITRVIISWARIYSSSGSRAFLKWSTNQLLVYHCISGTCQVITCWKQSRFVRKWVDPNPRLKST